MDIIKNIYTEALTEELSADIKTILDTCYEDINNTPVLMIAPDNTSKELTVKDWASDKGLKYICQDADEVNLEEIKKYEVVIIKNYEQVDYNTRLDLMGMHDKFRIFLCDNIVSISDYERHHCDIFDLSEELNEAYKPVMHTFCYTVVEPAGYSHQETIKASDYKNAYKKAQYLAGYKNRIVDMYQEDEAPETEQQLSIWDIIDSEEV